MYVCDHQRLFVALAHPERCVCTKISIWVGSGGQSLGNLEKEDLGGEEKEDEDENVGMWASGNE